jgi:hypothetical protein
MGVTRVKSFPTFEIDVECFYGLIGVRLIPRVMDDSIKSKRKVLSVLKTIRLFWREINSNLSD